jgi:hypothetical protein
MSRALRPRTDRTIGICDNAWGRHRLRRFLAEYGWTGTRAGFLDVVQARVRAHAADVRSLAATGDPLFARLASQGAADNLDIALAELEQIT